MAQNIKDFSRLCIHTVTTKPWNLGLAASRYAAAGVSGITVWRQALDGYALNEARRIINNSGLRAVSLCRGGFFPAVNRKEREKAIEDNLDAIDAAASIGAPLVILVCGSSPYQSLETSRGQILEGIIRILPYAEQCGIRMAIEPLHPMYADSRSAINTLKQANDMCDKIDSDYVGVAIDVYHLWWDDELEREIRRSGKNNKIFAFHVSDWLSPTQDMLNDRGLMGDGCIPIRRIRGWVEAAGFDGFHEVEIFSTKHWNRNQDEFLQDILKAYWENV